MFAFADRIFTFLYFIPTMVKLMDAWNLSESKTVAITNLNYVRHALGLVVWLIALKAFSLLYEQFIAEEKPKVVSERLGHSTIVLTLDTCSCVLPHMQQTASARL